MAVHIVGMPVNDYCLPFPCYSKLRKSSHRATHFLTSSRFISISWALMFFCRSWICCTCSVTLRFRTSSLLLRSSDTWLNVLSLSEIENMDIEVAAEWSACNNQQKKEIYLEIFPVYFLNTLLSGYLICELQVYLLGIWFLDTVKSCCHHGCQLRHSASN